jgi:hypothetical protein
MLLALINPGFVKHTGLEKIMTLFLTCLTTLKVKLLERNISWIMNDFL